MPVLWSHGSLQYLCKLCQLNGFNKGDLYHLNDVKRNEYMN